MNKFNFGTTEQYQEITKVNREDKEVIAMMTKLMKIMAEQQTELLTVVKGQQTERVENEKLKIELQFLKEQIKKDHELERIKKELKDANEKLSHEKSPMRRK